MSLGAYPSEMSAGQRVSVNISSDFQGWERQITSEAREKDVTLIILDPGESVHVFNESQNRRIIERQLSSLNREIVKLRL